jgi:hypothetical protein
MRRTLFLLIVCLLSRLGYVQEEVPAIDGVVRSLPSPTIQTGFELAWNLIEEEGYPGASTRTDA